MVKVNCLNNTKFEIKMPLHCGFQYAVLKTFLHFRCVRAPGPRETSAEDLRAAVHTVTLSKNQNVNGSGEPEAFWPRNTYYHRKCIVSIQNAVQRRTPQPVHTKTLPRARSPLALRSLKMLAV